MSFADKIFRHVPAVFAAVMFVFIAVLTWLGWVLIEQDGNLETQRKRDTIETSVSKVSAILTARIAGQQRALRQYFFEWPQTMDSPDSGEDLPFPTAGVTLLFKEGGVETYPDSALRFLPVGGDREIGGVRFNEADRVHGEADRVFNEADLLEFRRKDLHGASQLLIGYLKHPDQDIRAEALVRLARIRRKQSRSEDALELYLKLAQISSARVAGIPGTLLGRFGRCAILEEQGSFDKLANESRLLGASLLSGGHRIGGSTYEFYAQSTIAWALRAGISAEAEWVRSLITPHVFSDAAVILSDIRTAWRNGRESSEGIRSAYINGNLVIMQWYGAVDKFIGTISDSLTVRDLWFNALTTEFRETGIGQSVTDGSGNLLFSIGHPDGNIRATRTLASAEQTWTINSYVTALLVSGLPNRSRRYLLLGVLILVIGIVATSTYFLSRALKREREVSQLKSEFVSAVSHEFRTPLTSMRQLTEMLSSGRVQSPRQVQEYYSILSKESQRLSRLVESLLNMGRMEAGGYPYIFEAHCVGDLVNETVDEFKSEMSVDPGCIQVTIDTDSLCNLDRDTFKIGLWNLLDNAVKYTGDHRDIRVVVSTQESDVSVSVTDNGQGITMSDRNRVFEKFVRGSDAVRVGTKGTGLGLYLAKKIMEQHGGRITLESEVNKGSTFRLILPRSKQL